MTGWLLRGSNEPEEGVAGVTGVQELQNGSSIRGKDIARHLQAKCPA
jgi:hypothetical protein